MVDTTGEDQAMDTVAEVAAPAIRYTASLAKVRT